MPSLNIRRAGLTRFEWIVIVGCLLMTAAVLIPMVQTVRETGRAMTCQDHLHTLAISLTDYASASRPLPPGWVSQEPSAANWSWGAMILPYIESSPAYDVLDVTRLSLAQSAEQPDSQPYLGRAFVSSNCPSAGKLTTNPARPIATRSGRLQEIRISNYVGVHGTDWTGTSPPTGCFGQSSSIRIDEITDGLAHTLLLGERSTTPFNNHATGCDAALAIGISFADGRPREDDALGIGHGGINGHQPHRVPRIPAECRHGFSSQHPDGPKFAAGDGRVMTGSPHIDAEVFLRLLNRSDGQPVRVP